MGRALPAFDTRTEVNSAIFEGAKRSTVPTGAVLRRAMRPVRPTAFSTCHRDSTAGPSNRAD